RYVVARGQRRVVGRQTLVVGDLRPRPGGGVGLGDVDALQAAVRVGVQLLRRLVDGVVAGAVGGAGEGDVADVARVGRQVAQAAGDPGPGAVHLGEEAVVVVPAAPA